jgi:long-chain acyl-CoA synthetase
LVFMVETLRNLKMYLPFLNLIFKDFSLFKPTVFASVPRIYNKLYEGITTKTNALTGTAKKVSDMAVKAKLYWLKNGTYYTHKLWDKLVFNKVKQLFGGYVYLLIIGKMHGNCCCSNIRRSN